jgi:hypothetical protein
VGAAAGLLHGVAQLVGKQTAARGGLGIVLPGGEDRVLADGVGQGMHGLRRFLGTRPGMDADGAEVVADARLHEGAGVRVKGAASGAKRLMHDGRRLDWPDRTGGVAAKRWRGGVDRRPRCRSDTDYTSGDGLGFGFERIVG